MALSKGNIPSIVELLYWQFGQTLGRHAFPAPCQDPNVGALLQSVLEEPLNLRFIPLANSLLPHKQAAYNYLVDGRSQYGISHLDLADQEIMTLQSSGAVDLLYNQKNSHFRPAVADSAITILISRALRTMLQQPGFPVLVVAGWNAEKQDMQLEMLAAKALAQCKQVKDLFEVTLQLAKGPWCLRHLLHPGLRAAAIPNLICQTYVHDDKAEPRQMICQKFPRFRRVFCDDHALTATLRGLAGNYGTALLQQLKQPAHRADVFRYVYHYEHGGMYLDIKCGFVLTWDEVLSKLAADWGTAQNLALGTEHSSVPEGTLPSEYLVMAIGVKEDHIFQGIIYGKPGHPLLRQAIQHAFGRKVFALQANLEYMIFCKFLWNALKQDMGVTPTVGWNISRTYGPIYLFQERLTKSKKNLPYNSDGHYFVTTDGTTVAYTRCWQWQKGFKGDPSTKQRTDQQLLVHLPEAMDEATQASHKHSEHSSSAGQVAQPTPTGVPPPTMEDLTSYVEASIEENSFQVVMDVVKSTHYYDDLDENDVLRLLPRGLTTTMNEGSLWLSCRHCTKKGRPVLFSTSAGIPNHFASGRHQPEMTPPDERAPFQPTRSAPPPPPPHQASEAALPPSATRTVGRTKGTGFDAPEPPSFDQLAQQAVQPTGPPASGDQPKQPRTPAPPPAQPLPSSSPVPPVSSPSEPGKGQVPQQARTNRSDGTASRPGDVAQPNPRNTEAERAPDPLSATDMRRTPSISPARDRTPPPGPRRPEDYKPPTTGAPQMDYQEPPAPIRLPDLTRADLVRMLSTPILQDWIRAMASFNVLASPVVLRGLTAVEQQPLWASRVEALRDVPPLFDAIQQCATDSGGTWEAITTARRTLSEEGKPIVATGSGDTYKELDRPTQLHGLIGGLFVKMWDHPDLTRHLRTYADFDLVANTILTIYNETAKSAGLPSRMMKYAAKRPGEEPPRKMRIEHSKGDRPPPPAPLPSYKRPQQQQPPDGKRQRELGHPSSSSAPSGDVMPDQAWDWQWAWQWQEQDWNWHEQDQSSRWSWRRRPEQ